MEKFAKKAAEILSSALKTPFDAHEFSTPPDRALADFAFPCFKLSKEQRKSPAEVAKALVASIPTSSEFTIAAVGPYVNFTVKPEAAVQLLSQDMSAKLPANTKGKWVLEYSSPNIAKPFNIYHLRGTALGAALARVGKHRGFETIRINHLGDWGTQYGKLSVALKMYEKEMPANPGIPDLVNIYVKFHQDLEKDPSLEDQAREAFVLLEKNDPTMTTLWKKCVKIAMDEFMRTYKRLDIDFDYYWGESHYKDLLKPLIAQLKQQGVLVESEGALVIPVTDRDGRELPPCIMEKSDGASIYATRDVAAAIYRHEKFNFDRMTYIVGGEQKMHFQQVFGALRVMGYKWESKCEHVPTGLYRFKDAKMSTRKGNFVTLEEVLEQAKDKAKELMKAREGLNLSEKELDATAEAVAVGAVVFHDLSTDPARDVEFDLDRVVSFEGETGPYLQYAYVRCLSILRKASEKNLKPDLKFASMLVHPAEITLIKQLGHFGLHLDRTLTFSKASQLCNYLIDVTKDFGHFYRECHVIGDDVELSQARLALVDATRAILAKGLELLGIPRPEKM